MRASAYGLVYGAAHFVVAQFGLGLSFKLGLGHLHRDDGDEAFSEIFTRNFHLGFFEGLGAGVFGIFFQYAGKGHAETGFVCSTFDSD